MKIWKLFLPPLVTAVAILSLWAADPLPEPPPPAEAGTLIVIDAAGKEQKLKPWKIVSGTRPLTWLAPAAPKEDPEKKDGKEEAAPRGGAPKIEGARKAPAGPEALAFREENSTDYQEGVLTLIPLDRIRTIEYDGEKRTAAVRVATTDKPEADDVITGSTKYVGVNRITIEAEVDKGKLGVADIKFLGGAPEKGIRAVRFPAPKAPTAAASARPAFIVIAGDDKKNVQKVSDLQGLYQFGDGTERLIPTLLFKKTLKLDMTELKRLVTVDSKAAEGKEMDVTLKDGQTDTLTLLKTGKLEDKDATLVGLVARVPAGYKLFPIHTVTEIQFDERKEEKKPEKKEGDKDK
jgi:hypothetical protein